jgi:chromosome segregation ATPase
MGETFAQRRSAVNASLRRVRQQYRKADTRGEVLERELDRLINRKTIVGPQTLQKLQQRYEEYIIQVNAIDTAMTDALLLSVNYA